MWLYLVVISSEFFYCLFLHFIRKVDKPLNKRLAAAFKDAKSKGLWVNTYADNNQRTYFGEGVQSYFNSQDYANPPDGKQNHVNSR